jgi:hypothetical protein
LVLMDHFLRDRGQIGKARTTGNTKI